MRKEQVNTWHGGEVRGGSVLRTDPRCERPEAEGECGVRPPELSKRLTGRNGETDRAGKKGKEKQL